jgi:hypothetical protein
VERVRRAGKRFLVGIVVATGLTACFGSESSRPIDVVVEGLGLEPPPLTRGERFCLERRLREEPMLRADLAESGQLEDLDPSAQARVFVLVGWCSQATVGRLLVAAFEPLTAVEPGRTFVGDSQYRCLGGHVLAPSWVIDMRYAALGRVLTTDQMTQIASALYMCAPDYVVNGPLARSFDLRRENAACLASRVVGSGAAIPEVVRIMFGQGERKRSGALETLIASCAD